MKKLTRRQQDFLRKFLDLYTEGREPLHYTAVAKHLGVGNVSAYEMLRLLEEHGLVEAQYQLPVGFRGPGRASVVFRPTPLAAQEITRLGSEDVNRREWEAAKEHILKQIETGKAEDYEVLIEELLVRMSEQRAPVIYGAEMITAIILGLRSLCDTDEARGLEKQLKEFGKLGELGLGALAGFGVALSVVERTNRRLASFLLGEVGRFQAILSESSEENRRRLADFACEVVRLVAG
ncbi:MAG TPA: hypothetical protein PK406_09895 [Verrucomicrobiota bacterium]|nr:hypothetical protein [Verrucomicrobiota bacterium]